MLLHQQAAADDDPQSVTEAAGALADHWAGSGRAADSRHDRRVRYMWCTSTLHAPIPAIMALLAVRTAYLNFVRTGPERPYAESTLDVLRQLRATVGDVTGFDEAIRIVESSIS